jgi:DNA-binding transcriptional ArsR family regulator
MRLLAAAARAQCPCAEPSARRVDKIAREASRNIRMHAARFARFASVANEVSSLAIACRRPYVHRMSHAPHIAEVAALVGDPARANILCELLGGRALTATELAAAAGVTPQTTSGHLGKLMAARLLVLMKQGRHRYYRLAGPHVGQMLESIMNVAMAGPPRFQPKSRLDEPMRRARTCYDHIAGLLGVGLAERLTERDLVILGDEAGEVTPAGADFLSKLGVDLSAARAKRRIFCRPCVDWSERRPHIGGAVGAALASRCFELKWIERVRDSRALAITPVGRRGLTEVFGISV